MAIFHSDVKLPEGTVQNVLDSNFLLYLGAVKNAHSPMIAVSFVSAEQSRANRNAEHIPTVDGCEILHLGWLKP